MTPVDEVRASVSDGIDHGSPVAFQSTLATAVQTFTRALASERAAEDAALSLAQRRLLSDLRAELESARAVLNQALTDRGRCLIQEPERDRKRLGLLRRKRNGIERVSWAVALRETLYVLGDGAEVLADLAQGQPAHAPARALAESTARLLEQHHEQLRHTVEREHDA